MAVFKFIGDPREGHEDDGPGRTSLGGIAFERNVPTEVADERLIGKLRNNTHFEEMPEIAVKGTAEIPSAPPNQDDPEFRDVPEEPVKRGPGRPRKVPLFAEDK